MRDSNTRVWEYTRQVPVVDDESGRTELVIVRNQVYEKADNLCYNRSTTKIPDWVPTIEEITPTLGTGFAYQAKQGAYQVSFVGVLSASGGSPWSIIYQTKGQTLRLGIKYLGYYDSSNGSSIFLATPNAVVPQLVAPNKLVYRNAFPGVDIEYVYTKGAFLQNAIINSVSSYQSPSHYGLNPASTQLIVATELDLATTANVQLSVNKQKYRGESIAANDCPIELSNSSTGNQLCSFEPNQAFDSQASKKEIAVQQRVIALNGKHYLVEGIPLNWVSSATLPVTIDYELRNGGLNRNEVWKSGYTYHVSGTYSVNNGYTLVIEGGAIVKLGTVGSTSNIKINATSGAQIQVMGSKYNYVVFTSANDTTVGAYLNGTATTAQTGDYSAAFVYSYGAKNNSRVNYAKIRYGLYGIRYYSSGLTIRDSIFRNCTTAIYCSSTSSAAVTNNIISGCSNGVVADLSSQVQVNQNTIDSTYNALYAASTAAIRYYDNIISNSASVAYDTTGGSFPEAHHNAFYNYISYPHDQQDSQYLGNCPYTTSPNGQYYLLNSVTGCIDKGSKNAGDAGMTLKTVFPPRVYANNETSGSEQWPKVVCDTYIVDIGYHYDPVDVVIQPAQNNLVKYSGSATLTIDPGVVVSFYRTASDHESKLRVSEGGKLTAAGNTENSIQFTSIYATSDEVQAPLRGGLDMYDYSAGIIVHGGANPDSDIEYCDFKYANTGIRALENLNLTRPIQNNYFSQNYFGVTIDSSGNNLVNNLFDQNRYGAAIRLTDNPPSRVVSYLQSNTFYANDTAILINPETGGRSIIARLENNIITSNIGGAIGVNDTGCSLQVETRNNSYWNNELNVDGTYISINNSTTENKDIINSYSPMLVHKSRVADNQKIFKYPHDGFYLGQRTGDASRFPLRQHNLTGISIDSISQTPVRNAIIRVYAADNDNAKTCLGTYGSDSGYTDGADCWGNILIELVDDADYWTLNNGDYLELTFANGDKLKVYLPNLSWIMGSLYLWVAQDGSTYYGTMNYLAQHDAMTWFPFREHDLSDIDVSGLSEGFGCGQTIHVYACTGYGLETELGYYDGGVDEHDPPHYVDDSTDSWGNIKLGFEGAYKISDSDYLVLYFTSGTTIQVSLSGLAGEYFGLELWIAEDNSYRLAPNWNWSLNQDANFAMQWDIPSITGSANTSFAAGAYDGGARSPAIDKGAVRIIPYTIASTNSDVTCSNFASSGFTNTYDTEEYYRDCATTLRWIAETTAADYTDPVGRLDLGYHYKGAVVYTTDIVSTFRFNNKTYVYDMVGDYLDCQSEGFRKIVAGSFDTTMLNGTNIVVFPASGLRTTDQYIALGYHIQGTPVTKGIAEYSMPTTWDGWSEGSILCPNMKVKHIDVCAAPNGTIYVAINLSKQSTYSGPVYDAMRVYRYDANSYHWTSAVTMEWMHSGDSSLSGLAIAADTGYLWLAISIKDIKIATIPYSSFTATISITSSIWKTPLTMYNLAPKLDMSYDEVYTNDGNKNPNHDPTVRLLYNNPSTANHLGDDLVHSARLEFVANGITIGYDTAIWGSDTATDEEYCICCNPIDVTGGQNQAFATYEFAGYPARKGFLGSLDARNTDYDVWNKDTEYGTMHAFQHDLTYRGNGKPLVVWATNHVGNLGGGSCPWVYSNVGDIDPIFGTALEPRVSTNLVNKRDTALSWHSFYAFDGGDLKDGEGVIVCQELLP
jgi:hypothetical protein